jgi:hypothetical protein
VNETYRGVIEVGPVVVDAFVKFLPERQLVNEILASVLAAAAGLSVPKAYLVKVDKDDYPKSPFIQAKKSDIVAFATAPVGHCQARRRVDVRFPETIKLFLSEWKEWAAAASFDEWVANVDRHFGNLMIGAPGEVWLIDHSHAFTGPDWRIRDLIPEAKFGNKLCMHASPCLDYVAKMNAYSLSLQASKEFTIIDATGCISASGAERLLSGAERRAVTQFVVKRADKVHEQISARLGIPALTLGAPA